MEEITIEKIKEEIKERLNQGKNNSGLTTPPTTTGLKRRIIDLGLKCKEPVKKIPLLNKITPKIYYALLNKKMDIGNKLSPMVFQAKLMVQVLKNKICQEKPGIHGMKPSQESSWEKVAKKTMESYEYYLDKEKRKIPEESSENIILGMVTTWNTKCGIASYSNYLIDNLDKGIAVKIFANRDCKLNGPEGDNVFRCWQRGGNRDDSSNLYEEITRQKVQIVNIQYNFGFFGVKQLGDLIIRLKQKDIGVVITFHSTAPVKICGSLQSLKSIAVELRCADKLLVHNSEDVHRLKAFDVSKNVILFPHGMFLFDDENRYVLRKVSGIVNSKIVASFGFLLPHKGILELIECLPHLINPYNDILVLLVCALYPDPISNKYFKQCMNKVDQLQLHDHVRFFTDYLDENEIIKLLHLADMFVFPYKNTNESSSAAIRFALGARRPIITSSNPIFDDFKNEVYQIQSVEPLIIANAIKFLYENEEAYARFATSIVEKGEKQRWEVVAKSYENILREVYNRKSNNIEFKLLNMIDGVSKDIMILDLDDKSKAAEILANEIYQTYTASSSNI